MSKTEHALPHKTYGKKLLIVWREDWPCYASLFAYIVFVVLLYVITGWQMIPLMDVVPLLSVLAQLLLAAFVLSACILAIRRNPAHPLRALPKAGWALLDPRLIAAGLMLLLVLGFYWCFLSLKHDFPLLFGPYRWDPQLANLDAWLHGGRDPWRWLAVLFDNDLMGPLIRLIYEPVWFCGVVILPVLLMSLSIPSALRRRYFYTYMLCWILLGHVLAGVLFSGGPVFYAALTGDTGRFAELETYLQTHNAWFSSVTGLQQALLTSYTTHQNLGIGGITAMPSMHLSMATLAALMMTALWRKLKWPMTVYLILIQMGSVLLGWHYAIDGYLSIISTYALWYFVGILQKHYERPAPTV